MFYITAIIDENEKIIKVKDKTLYFDECEKAEKQMEVIKNHLKKTYKNVKCYINFDFIENEKRLEREKNNENRN